jgi:hypothetical protein
MISVDGAVPDPVVCGDYTFEESWWAENQNPSQGALIHVRIKGIVSDDSITLSPRSRFRAAMVLAMAADALQIVLLPMFSEGAMSPADDVLDLAVGAVLVRLLGWHWEFLPSFFAELIPGVDLVPFWTLAVANVYRKSKASSEKQLAVINSQPPAKVKA